MTRRAAASPNAPAPRQLFDQSLVKSRVTDAALVERRRQQIVAAAVALFSRQGFERTTMQQVARKAGISTGLIYQYARTKDDVLLLALLSVLDAYRREIPAATAEDGEPLAALRGAFEAYCRVVDGSRDAAVLAYRATNALPRAQREIVKRLELETNALIGERVRRCVAAGLFRAVDVELATYQLVVCAHTWALKHWRLGEITTIDRYIDEGFDFFVRALATPAGLAKHGRPRGAARRPSASGGRA